MGIRKINWPGLASAITVTILLVVSVVYAAPWWQLSIGQGMGQVNISPFNFDVQLLGIPVEIPILWFVSLSIKLTLLSAIVALFICSIVPERKYSKNLLNFGYKKPIMLVIDLILLLIVSVVLINLILLFNVPFMGTATATFTAEGATVNVPISTGFTWVFWLAIIITMLAVIAKFYHRKIINSTGVQPKSPEE